MRLKDKVAVVTGSSRGIGKEVAIRFAKEGCKVVINHRNNEDRAVEAAREIRSQGCDSVIVQADVSQRSDVQRLFRTCVDKFGQVDILVNNAGILQQKPFESITDTEIDTMLAVCLKGPFISCQEVLPFFKEQKSGRVVNVASIGGQFGGPKAPHYSAAKAGLICLTKSCARLMAPFGATVNCISPGFVQTDMSTAEIEGLGGTRAAGALIPVGRIGQPGDIAAAAVYLASDEASFVTGHVLNVNGGQYML